jgi:prepilin-type N-terminal cleavage/methylation domain-containing protein
MKSFPNQNGFTLIEMLFYISISSVVLLFASMFLGTILESRIKNQMIAEVEQQGMQAVQQITQIVRNGATITTPAVGATASSLVLTQYDSAKNPTTIDISGGVLRITEGVSGAIPLTNSKVVVSALSVSNLSRASTPDTIRIIFTVTATNVGNRNEYSVSKTFEATANLRQP